MKLTATIEISIQPFAVPNYVRAEQQPDKSVDEGRAIALEELDPYTLDALCSQFREDVFKKAKKQPPPACAVPR